MGEKDFRTGAIVNGYESFGDGESRLPECRQSGIRGQRRHRLCEDEKFFEAANAARPHAYDSPQVLKSTSPCRLQVKNPKLALRSSPKFSTRQGNVSRKFIRQQSLPIRQTSPYRFSLERSSALARIRASVRARRFRAGAKIGGQRDDWNPIASFIRTSSSKMGVTIGDRVILHAGVVIGTDGFGYVRGDVGYHKFPQIGTVVIRRRCRDRSERHD
jgi:hypothetical protein